MIMAIALLVLGAFVAIAIVVSAMSSRDGARRQLEAGATEQLARDAGTTIAAAYSGMTSGEFDNFVPGKSVLTSHQTLIKNSKTIANPAGYTNVRPEVTGAGAAFTFQQPIDGDGGARNGYWQVYGVDKPDWGETKNGTVTVYVRAWTQGTDGAVATKPVIYEMTLRPQWFADYQMIFDGKMWLGGTAKITGRVHSNGTNASFNNAYGSYPWQIKLGDPGDAAACSKTTRVTSAKGPIDQAGPCKAQGGKVEVREGQHINLLRAEATIARLRELCGDHSGVRIVCTSKDRTKVQLSGSSVRVDGSSTSAATKGVIVIADGDIDLSGEFSGAGRALVIAAADKNSARYGDGRPPSVWVKDDGGVGSGTNAKASFGAIAQGNIILDETSGCPNAVRGAFISISGMMSANPTWLTGYEVAGGDYCKAKVTVEGSIVGHYPPLLDTGYSGFEQRLYSMHDELYHNPPPMYPTTADWQVVRFGAADLDKL